MLRSEVYALDGHLARSARPYTVTEHRYRVAAVLDGRTGDPPDLGWMLRPVVVTQSLATRTTQWECGDDPMHRFVWTEGYDAYGRARYRGEGAVPRGQDPARASAGADPYLVIATVTHHALRDDAERYVTDRVAATTRLEVRDPGALGLAGLWATVPTGAAVTALLGHELVRYDGEPFTGLPLGELGDRALPTHTEQLVHTASSLAEVYRGGAAVSDPPELPPQLDGTPPGDWPAEYPLEYRDGLPAGAGYIWHAAGEGYHEGWYASTARRRYGERGQLLVERDASGHDSTAATFTGGVGVLFSTGGVQRSAGSIPTGMPTSSTRRISQSSPRDGVVTRGFNASGRPGALIARLMNR